MSGGASVSEMVATSDRWWNDVWRDGNIEAMAELFTDTVIRHTSTGTETLSRASYERRIADAQRALCSATTRVDDRTVDGDRVWTRATSRGINRETGEPALVTWLIIQRFEGARIAEQWVATLSGVDWIS